MTDQNYNTKKPASSKATVDIETVIREEKKRLKLNEGEQANGFAISGGGIRSASFGLGVMQAFVDKDELKNMDYLSTVSGGGYLGSALTWALHQGKGTAGTLPHNFPLGAKGSCAKDIYAGKVGAKDNKLLDFIRQHSSYLIPTSQLNIISFAAMVLRSMILSLFVYFTVMLIVMTLFVKFNFFASPELADDLCMHALHIKGVFIPLGIVLVILFLAVSFLYSLGTFFTSEAGVNSEYKFFINGQILVGYTWKIALTCLLIGTIPYVKQLLDQLYSAFVTASASSIFGALVGIWQYMKAQKNEKSSGPISSIVIYLGVFALIYGLLLLAYIFGKHFIAPSPHVFYMNRFIILVGVSLLFGIFVNLNLVGPHRIWRDRLMEAFMPDENAVKTNSWHPAKKADRALMKDMCDEQLNPKPYHIVNTNLILTNSPQVKYRGRGGDNFIISPLYCGSDATEWKTTDKFQTNGRSRGITLATAMATSAAALNPNAGCSGEGVTRNALVSILLNILNLRLGYWTSNPKNEKFPFPPNFFIPGMTSELLGKGLNETNSNIQLSDGGHFENLAIYELIRRKAKIIVVSDGGCDPLFNFDDLANAVEKVRVDFGAKIAFTNDYGMNSILSGAPDEDVFQKKYSIAKRGFAIADIYYNNGLTGKLFYIKLAMVNELPTDIYSYKGLYPDFPHQSTADQFFDEKQFEAYRELGYYVTKQMLEAKDPTGKKLYP